MPSVHAQLITAELHFLTNMSIVCRKAGAALHSVSTKHACSQGGCILHLSKCMVEEVPNTYKGKRNAQQSGSCTVGTATAGLLVLSLNTC